MKSRLTPRLGVAGLLATLVLPAHSQQASSNTNTTATATTSETASTDSSATVLVTGTRAGGRTVANSPAPIDVITARQLENTGRLNLLEALEAALPAFNLPARAQPDLGSIVRAGQLRNLDPSHTLVLVNGKRRHTTAIVNEDGFPGSVAADLALIPTGSIARVEVLRDGASALYGSDALAGVINIILKQDLGFSATSQLGASFEGDGGNGYARLNNGYRLGDRGFLHLGAEFNRQAIAVRNFGLNPGYLSYPAVRNSDGALVKLGPNNTLPAGTTANPAEASRNSNPWRNTGLPKTQSVLLSANLGYDLDATTQVYGVATLAHRKASSPQNFRLPNTIFNNQRGLLAVYPNGFTPYETTHEHDGSLSAGVRGETASWAWDASATYGRDVVDAGVEQSANYALSYPGAQTDFNVGQHSYRRLSANVDARRALAWPGLEQPLQWSLGAEYSREGQQLKAGEFNAYTGSGSSGLAGYLPVDASDTARHNIAAYVGVSVPWTPALLLDLATRAERYSDFGGNVSGRVSARYASSPLWALRGTLSNGFHAPSLVTQSYSNTSDHVGVPYQLAQPTSAAGRALGATALAPEKARNYTAGLSLTPTPSLQFSLDAYQVDVKNRLGVSSDIGIDRSSGVALDGSGRTLNAAQVTQIDTLLRSAGLTVGNGLVAHYFTNVGDTRSRGIDLTVQDSWRAGLGTLRATVAANFNKTTLTRVTQLPAALQGLPNIGTLTLSAQYDLLYRAPNDKQIVTLNYAVQRWNLTLRESRYGQLCRLNNQTGGDYYLSAAFVTDLGVGYKFSDQLNLEAGANNLFDRRPSQVPQAARSASNLAQYSGAYDNSGPLGVIGGTYYARASLRF